MSQPEDSDTAKMLRFTEARFARYRKDINHKLRTFELEDELRKLKGEPSSDKDDYEDVKPTQVVKRLCTGVIFLKEG
uniref:Uncharacterized protein n=1 Tax=Oryza nivara TaxID=4536 RepID=A0A0E0HQV7_ORYNI